MAAFAAVSPGPFHSGSEREFERKDFSFAQIQRLTPLGHAVGSRRGDLKAWTMAVSLRVSLMRLHVTLKHPAGYGVATHNRHLALRSV
jgi:hypothetical protein